MHEPVENSRYDSFDFFELLDALWKGRWTIVTVTGLFAVAGAAAAFFAREWYRADLVLVQVEGRGLSRDIGQLGLLESLTGISIGASSGEAQAPLAVLKSRELAREFIEDLQLTTVLLEDEWDSAAGKWKEKDPAEQPDIRDAVEYFEKRVRVVSEDAKTGLVTLSINWTDPVASAAWANELGRRVNEKLRRQALAEAERNISYLQAEMASTNMVALQQSIGKLLESEMQKLLLARGSDEFAFKVVDRAFEPKKPVAPRRIIVVLASILLGIVSSTIAIIGRNALSKRARHASYAAGA